MFLRFVKRMFAAAVAGTVFACTVAGTDTRETPGETGAAAATETTLTFVSTREKSGADAAAHRYLGDGRGETTYGRCVVEIETGDERSRLDGLVEFLLPVRRARIVAVEEIPPARFWSGLAPSPATEAARPIVLFVHGYAYGFGRGCRRVAEMQRALGDAVRVILFSWPSDGNPFDYADDRADLQWSVPELAAVIRELSERYGPDRVAIAAHSMGTAGVIAALERLRAADVDTMVAADLVLFAPDFGVEAFLDKRSLLDRMVGRTSVYVSGKDRLLWLSAWRNDEARLGQGGEHLVTGPGFQTIDVTAVGRYHPTGHEYHVFHPVVEADLVELLLSGAGAESRKRPQLTLQDGQRYWTLRDASDDEPAETPDREL